MEYTAIEYSDDAYEELDHLFLNAMKILDLVVHHIVHFYNFMTVMALIQPLHQKSPHEQFPSLNK